MLYHVLFYNVEGPVWAKSVSIFIQIINYALTFYVLLLYVCPKILSEGKRYYLFHAAGIFLLFFSTYCFQLKIVIPSLEGYHAMTNEPIYKVAGNALVIFSYPLFASVANYFNWADIKQKSEEAAIDKEMIEKEFHFLKSQFHSHFIFSFLHSCCIRIRNISPVTAHSIEDFSNMLSYSLVTPSDKPVSLEKEVLYMENFIALHKNLTNDLYISLTYEGDLKNAYILPRILIVFIENSVKHGITHDPLNPITIRVYATSSEVIFSIKSKNNHQLKMEESGMGLKHIKQILNLFYPDRHVLTISRTDDTFSCQLQVCNLKELEI